MIERQPDTVGNHAQKVGIEAAGRTVPATPENEKTAQPVAGERGCDEKVADPPGETSRRASGSPVRSAGVRLTIPGC